MSNALEKEFHRAMVELYKQAKAEAGYNATRFLSMIAANGGLDTARTLLHSNAVSDGYVALHERERLDLTVEALILDAEWRELFTDGEREIARKRLSAYGYAAEG